MAERRDVMSTLVTCLRNIDSEKITERKKQVEELKTLLNRNEVLQILDKNSDQERRSQHVGTRIVLTWQKVFRAVCRYIDVEAERFKEKDISTEAQSAAVLSNRNKEKKLCSEFFKFIVKKANSRGRHIPCVLLLEHILAVLRKEFTRAAFGLDYTNVLLKEILNVPQMFVEIKRDRFEDMIWLFCRLIKSPPLGWDRSLLTQVLYNLVSAAYTQYDIKPQELFIFFVSIFDSVKHEKASNHHENLLLSLMMVCRNSSYSCRAQLCSLGESLVVPIIQLWKTKPTETTKELMLEFLLMQMSLHHPKGVTEQNDGAFASDWIVWKELLKNLYQMIMKELNDICGKNRYSSSKDSSYKDSLHPCFIALAVEVCCQVFSDNTYEIQLTSTEQPCTATKKRRVEAKFKIFIDALQPLASLEIIPWLQVMSAILVKYPQMVSLEDVTLVLDKLIQINLSCHQLEVKTWLLTSCCATVDAMCVLGDKNKSSLGEVDSFLCDWQRLWELGVKSVALMHQCHETGHQLLSTMLNHKLIVPKSEFLNLYAPGSNNKLSRLSLQTLALYLQKYCIPSSALFYSVKHTDQQYDKDWFRHQILNWLFSIDGDRETSNVITLITSEALDDATLQLLGNILTSLSLQDSRKYFTDAIFQNSSPSEKYHWIKELEIKLLQASFDLSFNLCSDDKRSALNNPESNCGKLLVPLWNKVQENILNVSSKLFEWLSRTQTPNPKILFEQATVITLILQNLYLHGALSEENLENSSLTQQLKNLVNTATDILRGKAMNRLQVIPSFENRMLWLKDSLPLLNIMLMMNAPVTDKDKKYNQAILQWIALLFPPDLLQLLIDTIVTEGNRIKDMGIDSFSRPLKSVSFEKFSLSHSLTIEDDFDLESECSSRSREVSVTRQSQLSSSMIDEDLEDDAFDSDLKLDSPRGIGLRKGGLMDSDCLSEEAKIQLSCVVIISKWCQCLSAAMDKNMKLSPREVLKSLVKIARNKTPGKLARPEDIQMVLMLLKGIVSVQHLEDAETKCIVGDEDISNILDILKGLLNKYSRYQEICVAALKIISSLLPHLVCSAQLSVSENVENNRNHAVHLIHVLWKRELDQRFNKNVSYALSSTLKTMIKLDCSSEWAKWKQDTDGSDSQTEFIPVTQEFPTLLTSRHLEIRMFAATCIKYLFQKSFNPIYPQDKIFEDVCIKGITALEIQHSDDQNEENDERNNRVASLLTCLANVALYSPCYEKKAVFVMCQVIKDKGVSDVLVAKVLKHVATMLGYQTMQSFMDSHLEYLIFNWLKLKKIVEEFPFRLLEFESLSSFLKTYYKIIIPLQFYHLDLESIKSLSINIKCEWSDIMKECLPCIFSRIFSWYAVDAEDRRANQCHDLLESIFAKEVMEKALFAQLDEVVISLLKMLDESPESNSEGDPKQSCSSSPLSLPSTVFIKTLKYLTSGTDCTKSFISLLTQKQRDLQILHWLWETMLFYLMDSLQNILLSLSIQLSKSHRYHEQQRVLLMYHTFTELLLPEIGDGLKNCYLFVMKELIYTLINYLTEGSQNLELKEDIYIMCIDLINQVCNTTITMYSEDIGDLLPFMVSRLIPFVDESELGKKVLSLLTFLVIKNAGYLENSIACLDPFPNLPLFYDVREKQKELMYKNGPYSLQTEIAHFLESYRTTGKGTLEGLQHLHLQLISKKKELQVIIKDLQDKYLFSEDINASPIHQLICRLAFLCTPGNSSPKVQKEACCCLGEIGPVDLSATVLQPSIQKHHFMDGVSSSSSFTNPLYEGYCLVFHLLSDYLTDRRIQIKVTASEVLKAICSTKAARSFLYAYKQKRKDKLLLYLQPFLLTSKVMGNTPTGSLEQAVAEKINNISLWSPEEDNHSGWITKLVCTILESGVTKDELFQKLKPICQNEANFCEQLLPYLIEAILLHHDSNLHEILSHQIASFFAKLSKKLDKENSNSCSSTSLSQNEASIPPLYTCKASVQTMLAVVHHLRLLKQPGVKMVSAWNSNFLLDLDYLHIAQAAQFCSAHFTALLYTELWCDADAREKGRRILKRENSTSDSDSYDNCSQSSSPLSLLSSQDPARASYVYRLLLEGYSSIGDPDGVHGCIGVATDSHVFVQNHYMIEGKWDKLLNIYNTEAFSSGILKALKHCGLDHILQGYIQSHMLTAEEPTSEMLEYQCECAWKMSKWDLSVADNDSPGFHESLFKSLQCLKTENGNEFLKNLDIARCTELDNLSHTSLESARSIFPILSHLQMLVLVEEFLNLSSDIKCLPSLLSKWEEQSKIPYVDFEFVEPISWLQCILLQQQLALHHNNGMVIKGLVHCLEQHAVRARAEKHLETAEKAIHLLKSLNLSWEESNLKWQMEEARIQWTKSEHLISTQLLKSMLLALGKHIKENPDLLILYAEALSLEGKWLAETRSESSATIMKDYLEKAIEVLQEVNNESKKEKSTMWDAYLSVARYADSQYQNIVNYTKSATYQTKQELIQHSKEEVQKLRNNSSITREQRRDIIILETHNRIDQDEMVALKQDQQQFLIKAVTNYLHCLRGTDTHDIRIFRLIALWFQNPVNADIIALVKDNLGTLETYKFLPLMYQLAARMGMHTQTEFPNILTELITSIALDHPHHALPIILSLSNADKDPTVETRKTSNRLSQQLEDSIRKERISAAKTLVSKLQNTKLRKLILDMSSLCDAYISLAYVPVNEKDKSSGIPLKIPPNQPILKIRNLVDIPVITEELQIDKSCEYKTITGIQFFMPDFRLCGGITVPKVIKCIGTDGKEREQLVKGRDDLRQDAVMQQVFGLLNCLLKQNTETKKRKLHIRTYKVVPLSRRSGVLQWCEGTQILGSYLIGPKGAHNRYFPEYWSAAVCQTTLKGVKDKSFQVKRKTFDKICKNFPPAFRYFFLEHFPEPAAWFEHRQSFTQSAATCSIVGYILGLGDRHVNNILIDKHTAEVVHIDFGVAFEKGKILGTPETVPFRLTRDIVDGMGVCGVEGVFKRCCEKTLEVMRNSQEILLTILEVLLYDPLYDWTLSPTKAASLRRYQDVLDDDQTSPITTDGDLGEHDHLEVNKLAERALVRLQQKLQGLEEGVALSITGQVNLLVQQARDPDNLCRLFCGWQPYL